MSFRNVVLCIGSPVCIVTKAHPTAMLIVHIRGPEEVLRLDDHPSSRHPPLARAVTEWRCTDRPQGPDTHEAFSPMARPKGLQIMEKSDEIRLTTMLGLFRWHVTVVVRDGRLVVAGDSSFFTRMDHDDPYA